jgi:hypothetical protein
VLVGADSLWPIHIIIHCETHTYRERERERERELLDFSPGKNIGVSYWHFRTNNTVQVFYGGLWKKSRRKTFVCVCVCVFVFWVWRSPSDDWWSTIFCPTPNQRLSKKNIYIKREISVKWGKDITSTLSLVIHRVKLMVSWVSPCLSFLLSSLHCCYIDFHCSHLYSYYNSSHTLCIKIWDSAFSYWDFNKISLLYQHH